MSTISSSRWAIIEIFGIFISICLRLQDVYLRMKISWDFSYICLLLHKINYIKRWNISVVYGNLKRIFVSIGVVHQRGMIVYYVY